MNKEIEEGIMKQVEVQSTNNLGISIIKEFEGFRHYSYLCPAGKWTIGYGSTKYPDGMPVIEGEYVSEEQAEDMLKYDLERREHILNSFLIKHRIFLNSNQFSALISFGYNVGMGWITHKGSVNKALLRKNLDAIPYGMKKYVKARVKGWFGITYMKTLKGLVRRREKEVRLFWT